MKTFIPLIAVFLIVSHNYSDYQNTEVAKVISAEACGAGIKHMWAVSNVIAHRAKNKNKSAYEIVTQPNQFAGYNNKNKEKIYQGCKKDADYLAKNIMKLKDITNGADCFRQYHPFGNVYGKCN